MIIILDAKHTADEREEEEDVMKQYKKLSPDYLREMNGSTLTEKALMPYCLTAQTNRIGIFNFSPALAAEELEIPLGTASNTVSDTVSSTVCDTTQIPFFQAFELLLRRFGWEYDSKSRVLYIQSWWGYHAPDNPKALIGYLKDLKAVRETDLIRKFAQNLDTLPQDLHDTFKQTIAKMYPDTYGRQYAKQYQIPSGIQSTIQSGIYINIKDKDKEKTPVAPTGGVSSSSIDSESGVDGLTDPSSPSSRIPSDTYSDIQGSDGFHDQTIVTANPSLTTNAAGVSEAPSKESSTEKSKPNRKGSKRDEGKTPMPDDFGISERVRVWAEEQGHQHLDRRLESFKLYASANGATYKNWDSAFMKAIMDDWAGLNRNRQFKQATPAKAPSNHFTPETSNDGQVGPPPADILKRMHERGFGGSKPQEGGVL